MFTAKLFDAFLLKLSVIVSISLIFSTLPLVLGLLKNIFNLSAKLLSFSFTLSILPVITSKVISPCCILSVLTLILLVTYPFFTRIALASFNNTFNSFTPISLYLYFLLNWNLSLSDKSLSLSIIWRSFNRKVVTFSSSTDLISTSGANLLLSISFLLFSCSLSCLSCSSLCCSLSRSLFASSLGAALTTTEHKRRKKERFFIFFIKTPFFSFIKFSNSIISSLEGYLYF